jgi:hypothetical protein
VVESTGCSSGISVIVVVYASMADRMSIISSFCVSSLEWVI